MTDRNDFDVALTSPDFSLHQHEVYRRLRESAPVYWSEALDSWLVTTFDLVDEVLTDPSRFTSVGAERAHIDTSTGGDVVEHHFTSPQLNISDPPDHTRIRRAFGRSFLPRAVSGYEAVIRTLAGDLLDGAWSDGGIDLVSAYAEPLPVHVVSELIGIPESLREQIPPVTLGQRYFFGEHPPSTESTEAFNHALSSWRSQLARLLEERSSRPRDDVLTRAATAVDEGKISLDEAIATCLHLIIAGNGTTTALIGTTVFLLLTHPEQLKLVTDDPASIPGAVEESLRFESPLPRDRRIATVDTNLGDKQIKAGDRVVSVLAAANRDPDQFDRPDSFDVTRKFTANQHAAFGRGIHFCLGAPVARLETEIALEEFFNRTPDPRLPADFAPEWHDITTHRGLKRLPIDTTMAMA